MYSTTTVVRLLSRCVATCIATCIVTAATAFADDAPTPPATPPAPNGNAAPAPNGNAAPEAPPAPVAPPAVELVVAPTPVPVPAAALTEVPVHCGDCSEGRKEMLSFGISTGLRTNMAQLGDTIAKDGTIELGTNTALRALGGTKNLFQSDKDDAVLVHNSASTNSAYKFLSSSKSGGPLMGMTIGGDVKLELAKLLHLPLFVRTGVEYTFRVSGGHHERVLGSAIETTTPLGGAVRDATGGVTGGSMSYQFDAKWLEIPLTVGLSIPLEGGHHVYGGFGPSYYRGGFSVKADLDERYVRAATTLVDGNTVYGPLVTDAIHEKINFAWAGLGFNYVLGIEARLDDRNAIFFEYAATGGADTRFSSEPSAQVQKLLTAVNSSVAGGVVLPATPDDRFLKRIAFPVVLGGGFFRIGYRFYAL